MKNIEVVAAAVVDQDTILITQRQDGDFKGLWEFPGGKIEKGESHDDALIREIREELDFEIKPNHHLITTQYQYPTFHLTMHVYLCSTLNGTPTLSEHAALQWVPYHNLDTIMWLPADIEVAHALYHHFNTTVQ